MFAPAFAPFANPEAIVNSKLALAFLEAGYDVDIITRNLSEESSYNYGSGWASPWNMLQKHTHIIAYPYNTRAHRFVDTALSAIRTGHPIHGCRWAQHAFERASELHAQKPFDVVLSRALPDSAHLPAELIARYSGLPWIANWNDASGAKNLPPYGAGLSGALGFFEHKLISTVVQRADVLTFPSKRLNTYVCHYLPEGSIERSITIPHAALRTDFVAAEHSGTFTLCHAGHLSAQRNPRSFLEGFARFIHHGAEKPKASFRIIGIMNGNVLKVAEQLGITEHVEHVGSLTYEATLQSLHQADVNVIIEAPLIEGVYLPAKFVDYVQAGRPILAVMPAEGEVNDILSAHGGGIAVDCTSSQDISDALHRLYSHWRQGNLMREFSSDRLYPYFAPEKIVSDYAKLFSKLIREH